MSFRERIEWVFRMGLLVFILAAAAFLSAVTAMRFAVQGREVTMPNLVGKSSADAQAILQGRGLQLKVVDRVYGDIPVNAVARQSPPEGERMKASQNAHVVLSLGPQNITTPSLTGESLRVARIQLLQVGLQLGEVTAYPSPAALSDTVLQQTPRAGHQPPRGFAGCAGGSAGGVRHALAGGHVPAGRGPPALFRGTQAVKDIFSSLHAMAEGHGHRANARSGQQNDQRIERGDGCSGISGRARCKRTRESVKMCAEKS
jgi:hypothetical protein